VGAHYGESVGVRLKPVACPRVATRTGGDSAAPRRRQGDLLCIKLGFVAVLSLTCPSAAQVGGGPAPPAEPPGRPIARDLPYPGVVELKVDATDIDHKVMRVEETVPIPTAGPLVLLYPQWDPASHAPTAQANALSGLKMTIDGRDVSWRRDSIDPFAFHVQAPLGARRLHLAFQYISPISPGRLEMEPSAVTIHWPSLLLYPAGWFARDLSIRANLQLPKGFTAFSSLRPAEQGSTYAPVSFEVLADSPVFAGPLTKVVNLGELGGAPVRMDLVADASADLDVPRAYRDQLAVMVAQAGLVFGPPHFHGYDFLISLSNLLPSGGGTEHLRSSENTLQPGFFSHPERNLIYQDLLAHEFIHSWNGKALIPSGLWTADLNTPSQDDLLWIYEGETEYWAVVLAARSGLRTKQQTLDLLAVKAAQARARIGRSWKSLADSSLDPVLDAGRTVSWRDWQGREDYYGEGVLLWLDVDTLIRERTAGRRSLDDFARAFYGGSGGSETPRTYTLDELCATLTQVVPMDWRSFFKERLGAHDDIYLLQGLRRGGYELIFTTTPTETAQQAALDEGGLDLRSSLGVLVARDGRVRRIAWNSPAFLAGLGPAAKLTSVNGAPYSDDALLAALSAATVRLGFVQDDRDRTVLILGAGPPRYPSLCHCNSNRWLDEILSARPQSPSPGASQQRHGARL